LTDRRALMLRLGEGLRVPEDGRQAFGICV
jgi:hypothetical protein